MLPGIRHFWDFDGKVGRLYGALPQNATTIGEQVRCRRFWIVLNPNLQIQAIFPCKEDDRHAEVFHYIRDLPPVDRFAGLEIPAPILVIPDVFEPAFCQHLIGLYERRAMRERILRRVNPEIEKVHFFKATRMERYMVGCYGAEDGGHFRPHRDNTTVGTTHRRFAVSINLNADFDGGELGFPEYGPRSYKAPPGTAIVFSCPLLHTVRPVTKGRRFAFLPFLYDEAAARFARRTIRFSREPSRIGRMRDSRACALPCQVNSSRGSSLHRERA